MRWFNSSKEEPALIERTSFLLFPKTIEKETRWLEKTTWILSRTPWGDRSGRFWYTYEDYKWGTIDEYRERERLDYERRSNSTYFI